MNTLVLVRSGCYQDSARLMQVSRELAAVPGVLEAVAMMGTETNRRLLAEAGFAESELGRATPLDMVVALRAQTPEALDSVQAALDRLLAGRGESVAAGGVAAGGGRPRTVAEALEVPVGTVASRLSLARAAMRRALRLDESGEEVPR